MGPVPDPKPLQVPSQIVVDFNPGQTNFTAVYSISNQAAWPVTIVGRSTTCGCTDVTLSRERLGANQVGNVTVSIHATVPGVKGVLLIDDRANLYQTDVVLAPKEHQVP